MSDKKTFDALGNEIKLTKESFEFVQSDSKIHDAKFETKPTTFIKDAFKRFCKNKSSVAGAVVLGILVLGAIIIPFASPFNIETPNLKLAFLEPKLFEAGTGFWDGTVKYTNQIYDVDNEVPVGFVKNAVVRIDNQWDAITDKFSEYGHDGIYVFEADGDSSVKRGFDYLQHTTTFNLDTDYDWNVAVVMEKVDDLYVEGEYRLVLSTGKVPNTPEDVANKGKVGIDEVLIDWTKDVTEHDINISEVLKEAGYLNLDNAHLRFDLRHSTQELRSAIYLNSLKLTTNDPEYEELCSNISITDANETKNLASSAPGYWQSSGVTSAYKVEITYCDFTYDVYEAKIGTQSGFQIGQSIMDDYIAKGYCTYDYEVGPESFVSLSENCPINKVTNQKTTDIVDVGTIVNLTCEVEIYKYLGFDSMPIFLFGTNSSGYDLLKMAFTGLRTSLLLAIITSAVNFMIGLVWGSISGYFGGNVDLAMERFCEILGGMPWIVMMTLAIILMGNNLLTFGIALCLTGWMGTAGRTRTQFYRFKGREYILSSRTLGSSDMRLIFKHILPNALGTIVTGAVLMIPSVIFSEATLSYLQLGLSGVNSFGVLLSENQQYLGSHPMLIIFPSIIISLIMISFNLFGNGLRDALNPSLKGSD